MEVEAIKNAVRALIGVSGYEWDVDYRFGAAIITRMIMEEADEIERIRDKINPPTRNRYMEDDITAILPYGVAGWLILPDDRNLGTALLKKYERERRYLRKQAKARNRRLRFLKVIRRVWEA